MLETVLLCLAISLIFNGRQSKKRKWRKQSLDNELKELIQSSDDSTGIALDIKNYLLRVLDDAQNDVEKFNDAQLADADRILDRAGSSALFWMSEIAAQMTLLATAQLNGFPTNVGQELGESATPAKVIDAVVKI
ncbi:MAG: hypothetical protein NTV41_00300 [Actinobacteria bacterium]|nr:hypothetical protein [Actinomycetota bacterium]